MPGSKLPGTGTTIFSVMSKMAHDHDAINLSQGFPDFEGPQVLREAAKRRIGCWACGPNINLAYSVL